MREKSPACFASSGRLPECPRCSYRDACSFAHDDDIRSASAAKTWEDSAVPLSGAPETALPFDIATPRQTYTRDDLVALTAMLLRLRKDDRLFAVIGRQITARTSLSRIAREQGVSPQALHASIVSALASIIGIGQKYNKNRMG